MCVCVCVCVCICVCRSLVCVRAGYNDVWDGNNAFGDNTHTTTPVMTALFKDAVRITSYYTYKVCAPSRASILTGRYPWGVGYYDMHGPEVVPVDFKMTPALLKPLGYETHALGKWNLGPSIPHSNTSIKLSCKPQLDSRCVLLSDPSTFGCRGVPTKTRLESRSCKKEV